MCLGFVGRNVYRLFRLRERLVRAAGVEVEDCQAHPQHGVLGAKGQGLGELCTGQVLIIRRRQAALLTRWCIGGQAQFPRHRAQGVMRVGVGGIELRGGLQFAEGFGQAPLLAQRKTESAMRRFDLRLNVNGLAKGLLRPYCVVPAHQVEPLEDKVVRAGLETCPTGAAGAVGSRRGAGSRRQKTVSRRQKAESRRQKAESRRQKAESRRQWAIGNGQSAVGRWRFAWQLRTTLRKGAEAQRRESENSMVFFVASSTCSRHAKCRPAHPIFRSADHPIGRLSDFSAFRLLLSATAFQGALRTCCGS